MNDNPITKKITRHVSGRWVGYSGLNIHHPTKWTVGLLQQMLDDVRAAGYDDSTLLVPEIERDPTRLLAFRLALTEHVANEVPVVGPDETR
jgi:hypothetical protein